MAALNDRERFIVRERKLRDEPRTLESLGNELGLSQGAGAPARGGGLRQDAQEPGDASRARCSNFFA